MAKFIFDRALHYYVEHFEAVGFRARACDDESRPQPAVFGPWRKTSEAAERDAARWLKAATKGGRSFLERGLYHGQVDRLEQHAAQGGPR